MLEPQDGISVDGIVDWAVQAEKYGYGYIFRSDHLIPISDPKKKVPSPECWSSLGAVAAKTQRIKFGPMVSPVGFRNPAMLANMACSLYSYSKGRVILSVGAGWYQMEYEAYGYKFPDLQQRKDQLHEALQIIRPLTEGKHVTFKGKYFSADTECHPTPEPKMHLIVGAHDSQLIRWTAEYGDELNMFIPTREHLERAKRIFGEKTRSGSKIVLSQMGPFFIGESESDLKRTVQKFLKNEGLQTPVEKQVAEFKEKGQIYGTPDDIIVQIKDKRAAGIQRFYFQLVDPNDKEAVEILTKTLRKI
jgi:alkanesulfonate monooxygenase SsuD/methylene tetrahydromethanopterin reductase-like flavin-dependent oxidoreductase (luciferase family)